LAMVLTLVLLPPLAGLLGAKNGAAPQADASTIAIALAITLAKVAAFVVLMVVVGRRVVPWVLHYVAHTGSRELFRLAVLSLALGVAYGAATLFDVSFALGAFFAGMVLAESELSHRAAEESLPLRDAFAVLFFVSVGMLFDPMILLRDPGPVIATVLVIVVGKSVAALLIVLAFRHPLILALTIAASLAQIGEFSFILAGLGVALDLLPEQGRDLILAGAILSILLNPLFFVARDRLGLWLERRAPAAGTSPKPHVVLPVSGLSGHAVLAGFGRVGSHVGAALRDAGVPFLVIESRDDLVQRIRADGIGVIEGNAADPAVLRAANLAVAQWLIVAIPDAFEAGQVVEQGRGANPALEIIARAHYDAEIEYLERLGANFVIMGEREIARGMIAHMMSRGKPGATADSAHLPTAAATASSCSLTTSGVRSGSASTNNPVLVVPVEGPLHTA
jgi:CPA2 family monovalent cation:H+ antiporter-2